MPDASPIKLQLSYNILLQTKTGIVIIQTTKEHSTCQYLWMPDSGGGIFVVADEGLIALCLKLQKFRGSNDINLNGALDFIHTYIVL